MICKNCGYYLADHVGENRMCIGRNSSFNLLVNNMSATFLYKNEKGVAESRDAMLFMNGRQLARIDNIVQELLSTGNTDISINISVGK